MSADKWKFKTLPSLRTSSSGSNQYEPLLDGQAVNEKRPRVITKALRSLSSSSLDSINSTSPRRSASSRRLQKSQSGSGPGSMIDRLHKRYSKDMTATGSPPPDGTPMPKEVAYASMKLLRQGFLKPDISLLKARTEYLVLTDQCLVRLSTIEVAQAVFPQLTRRDENQPPLTPVSSAGHRAGGSDIRFDIPLRSIVAVFNEEGASPRFGLELWWFSPWPRLAYTKAHVFFSTPQERDSWLADIQRAHRASVRANPTYSVIPENLRARINRIVEMTEPIPTEGGTQNLTFPVARRIVGSAAKPGAAEESQQLVEGPSFFFIIGPCMCYLIEVLKAEHSTCPGDLRVKVRSFGTVTLSKFRASVACHEQRFVIQFRAPFSNEIRLDMASVHYRRVIEALTKVDRIIKPMWPQNLQMTLFDVKGLPPPLTLTSGNDLGGLERTMQAYCCAYSVAPPQWTVEWPTPSLATFRLLPPESSQYSSLQVLAVLRALRFNNYFKAISFRDVDLSALSGQVDHYAENVVYCSKTGGSISEEHHAELTQLPLLAQEMHNVMFASESVRSIDLTNVMGTKERTKRSAARPTDSKISQYATDVLQPILLLFRHHASFCNRICISHNYLRSAEVDELANVLVLDHVSIRRLEISNCGLGNAGLAKIWAGVRGQATRLESLDTSMNQGVVDPGLISHALSQLSALRRLNIAGNTRISDDLPLFDQLAIERWALEELDLSDITLNDATVDVLADYLQNPASRNMLCLRLNKCGLTGRQVARLFRNMGQARRITVHINANRLDDGIEDLCSAIACGFGPWSLFVQMVDFCYEDSYTMLWRALTVNKTIECISLAGSSTPDDASDAACQAVAEFFKKNDTCRFLDISGYDAKLDEGRLGKRFSTALSGIRMNNRIEHLRVRSQMLNINIGDLAEAISGNRTLHTIDCETNDFNLSNFRHLMKHVEENPNIRYFSAFSEEELARAIRKSVDDAGTTPGLRKRRSSMLGKLRPERPTSAVPDPLVAQLKDEWDNAVQALERILERNRRAHDETLSHRQESSPGLLSSVDVDGAFAVDFGGLALRESVVEGAKHPRLRVHTGQASGMDLAGLGIHGRVSRSQSMASSEAAGSPVTDAGSFGSAGAATPPDADGPDARADIRAFVDGAQSPDVAEDAHSNYTYYYHDQDVGLVMKNYRSFLGGAENRIEEEPHQFAERGS